MSKPSITDEKTNVILGDAVNAGFQFGVLHRYRGDQSIATAHRVVECALTGDRESRPFIYLFAHDGGNPRLTDDGPLRVDDKIEQIVLRPSGFKHSTLWASIKVYCEDRNDEPSTVAFCNVEGCIELGKLLDVPVVIQTTLFQPDNS